MVQLSQQHILQTVLSVICAKVANYSLCHLVCSFGSVHNGICQQESRNLCGNTNKRFAWIHSHFLPE
jgi:hypothetical protein